MNPINSPFKFLDSYERDDIDVFFGRKEETRALYEALSGVKHLLVYGPSGAGKTSLIECGLRNQFSNADWFALPIRRGNNMAASIFSQIRKHLKKPFEIDPKTQLPTDPYLSIGAAIEQLFDQKYKPVYLLFDQFEELLISGSDGEKKDFFTRLHELIRYKVPCRVLLIMREEFIGHLSEFEPLCPSIFQHRFRLEKMRRSAVQGVIYDILNAPRYQNHFQVNDPESLAENILKKLPDQKQEIELAHVQVFLSELWDRAVEEKPENKKPFLHQDLIKENDNLTTVLDSFLKKQLTELESSHGDKAPLELLAAMISEKHTKLQLSEKELQEKLNEESVELKLPLIDLLNEFKERRIIRQIKSDRETQYEISHDVLALVVGQNLTEEMKMRERAAEVYRVYMERKGFYSKEDMDFVRPYTTYKKLPDKLGNRIKDSQDYWKEKEKKELRKTRKQLNKVRWLLAAVVAGFLTTAYYGWESNVQKKLAKNGEAVADSLALVAQDSARVAQEQRDIAQQALSDLKIEQSETEIQRQIAEEKTKEAQTNLQKFKTEQLKKLLADANAAKKENRYSDALRAYSEALSLTFSENDINKIMNEMERTRKDKIDFEFTRNKSVGFAMKEAGDCLGALRYLRRALESAGNDPAIVQAIKDCEK